MSTPIERADDELTRIINHCGLDPDNTLKVETEEHEGRLFSSLEGVDPRQARLALGDFLDGRDGVNIEIVSRRHGDDYLIVTQPVRE